MSDMKAEGRPYPHVTVAGVTFRIHSKNERSCSINGRHFFICRCGTRKEWTIIEANENVWTSTSWREINRWSRCVDTKRIVHKLFEIAGAEHA